MKASAPWAALAALAIPAFARLEPPDQLDVGGGGLGPVVASFEAITNEVGYVVDDTFDGEITFTWTMKWDELEGGTAYQSWSMFQFFKDSGNRPVSLGDELFGIGTEWASAQISTFREPGGYALGRESGVIVEPGVEYEFKLVVDYHAGARDTAVISGGGFVNQPLAPGDWSFHHVRARVGSDGEGRTRADFYDISIESRGIGGVRGAGQVDPRFPRDRPAPPPAEAGSHWPPKRIRRLAQERDRLRAQISVLPQYNPLFLTSRLGYHSQFGTEASPPHQIDFQFQWAPMLEAIALAPAFNPQKPGAHAFPRRFKIEVLDARMGKFDEVVNWMEEDFPDPGPYPVFFSGINRSVQHVRMVIPPGMQESGEAYFALGEVFLFQQAPDGGLGDNMAVWGSSGVDVSASDSLSMPPLWELQCLHDGRVGFGLPLSDQTVASEDFMVVYDKAPAPDRVQLTLDLGRQVGIGQIDFWPAEAPHRLALPSLGFPRRITLELSRDPDFITVKEMIVENEAGSMLRENLLSVMGGSYPARYIRITLEGFGEYRGTPVLGLGEISVSEYGQVLSANCSISSEGIPDEYLDQLPRLVDGRCRHRLIMPEGEWLKGLALRRPLDRRLAAVERELSQVSAAWHKIQLDSAVWGGAAVLVGVAVWLAAQRRVRRRSIARLKWRITRDLHDEVGSGLGSIALASKRMEDSVPYPDVKTELSELSLLARETSASLREAVWVIDQDTIHLPDMIRKLAERAERVLYGVEVTTRLPDSCPNLAVPLPFKRHLNMLFKEAVYNIARHARATRAQITISAENGQLRVEIGDNGCGFDPAAARDGWGLDSMSKRAAEMGGRMELVSHPGEGTRVVLTVPFSALKNRTDHAYKTSN